MGKNNRIIVVDALRGFALLGIVLIHSVEHFDFFHDPSINFFFSIELDRKIMELAFLLISGKAYSIFALMFGLSFFIQMDRQKQKGIDFRSRFLWRLCILLVFGFLHSLLYEGDILHIYALLGVPLIFLDRFNNKTLTAIAIILALQIPVIYNIVASFTITDFKYTETFGSGLWGIASKTFATGSFYDVLSYNIWKGRTAVWGWTFYNGRYLQLIALFIIGLIIGRKELFNHLNENKKLFIKILGIGAVSAIVLFICGQGLAHITLTEIQKQLFGKLLNSYSALAYTSIILFSFILVYMQLEKWKGFSALAAYGKMSLSNYVFQAVIGVMIFYNYGLGMFKYMGSTWSLIYGICFFSFQVIISMIWLRHFYYGPLEWLWRALTWFNFNINFKKRTDGFSGNGEKLSPQ